MTKSRVDLILNLSKEVLKQRSLNAETLLLPALVKVHLEMK